MEFNIFAQLNTELTDFFQKDIHIAGTNQDNDAKYLAQNKKGYEFSQWKILNTVEMYYNSKFESGEKDAEGQRKVFLNICQFRSDVASKQVDLDVKDFTFIPTEGSSEWGAYFLGKRFKKWAKDNYFGELINQIVNDYPKYGTAVLKRVGSKLERVPLLTLRNQQDAKDLKTASFVIEEHKEMTFADMQAMRGWDLKGVEMKFGEKETVFERYGHVPLSFYKKFKGMEIEKGDEYGSVDCMAILMPKVTDAKNNEFGGTVLFLEKITERPYEEVHWKRQDGRWLGVGEIENQFENQITRNMLANLRRANLQWSAKKIFQSGDPDVAKNLVRDVKNGEVLKVNPNFQITQVDMATRSTPEFQSAEDLWEKNSDQKSFTFEVATGEALPSGTPFRLGVVLSNAVNSHFGLKRENLGLFFKRVVNELVLPIFRKDNRQEHTLTLFADEEGVDTLKQVITKMTANNFIKKEMLEGRWPNAEAINQKVTEEIGNLRTIFMKMVEGFYDSVEASADLTITGEEVDIPKKVETLTNLYNTLAQRQDPRADKVLARILAITGENMDVLAGIRQAQPQTMEMPQTMQLPQTQPV
jgi:hypothetical protein